MGEKINIKAKIERHSRILKDTIFRRSVSKNKYTFSYKIVLFFVVCIFPFYPVLASFVYDNTIVDFYRWDIDESSILSSYYWDDESDTSPVFESDDGNFLSINTVLDWKRDLTWTNEVMTYIIKNWDSIDLIASKFWVSRNSIYWTNNFTENKIIHPGDKIKIPPVSWIVHKIVAMDTVSSIAKKYSVTEESILKQNRLTSEDTIKLWQDLVIPGWIKKNEPPKEKLLVKNDKNSKNNKLTPVPKNSKTEKYAKKWYSISSSSKTEYTDDEWNYTLTKRLAKRTFYWWNCTRFVAQYKNITWWWNAKEWLRNAADSWVETWDTPKSWSIVVFNWRWYNPRYWHVWIVTWVKWDNIIVKDMNYRSLNEVTIRKIPKSDSTIKWYIYVD